MILHYGKQHTFQIFHVLFGRALVRARLRLYLGQDCLHGREDLLDHLIFVAGLLLVSGFLAAGAEDEQRNEGHGRQKCIVQELSHFDRLLSVFC